jgi:hypothetical protein
MDDRQTRYQLLVDAHPLAAKRDCMKKSREYDKLLLNALL